MTVLMLGWEFPPHISGGLGTACFGLTHALMDEGTQILFVVPKAHGDEDINIIDASAVAVTNRTEPVVSQAEINKKGMVTIDVLSSLSPYTMNEVVNDIHHWSWELPSSVVREIRSEQGVRYEFTGKYGPSLIDEVYRYAEVASEMQGYILTTLFMRTTG